MTKKVPHGPLNKELFTKLSTFIAVHIKVLCTEYSIEWCLEMVTTKGEKKLGVFKI